MVRLCPLPIEASRPPLRPTATLLPSLSLPSHSPSLPPPFLSSPPLPFHLLSRAALLYPLNDGSSATLQLGWARPPPLTSPMPATTSSSGSSWLTIASAGTPPPASSATAAA